MSIPRRQQPALTIRSSKAVDRLRLLTQDGRSQTEVIEEALERMPLPISGRTYQERLARLDAITKRIAAKPRRFKSMEEFDRHEYDENGLPR